MQGKARIKQYKTMQGGDEDPILRPRPTPLPSPHTQNKTKNIWKRPFGQGGAHNYNSG